MPDGPVQTGPVRTGPVQTEPVHTGVLATNPTPTGSVPERRGPTGPVAFVTGAGRGIGAAVARQLAATGWRVAAVDVCRDDPALGYPLASTDELHAVVTACGTDAAGADQALAIEADVRDQAALDAAVARTTSHFGRLDAVVAAAGAVAGGDDSWHTPDGIWQAMLEINLGGVWRTARAAVPALLAQPVPRHGRFVALASAGSTVGLARLAAYSAAKHGVLGLVRSLAGELAGTGVTANAVAPGTTDTAMGRASAAVYGLDPDDLVVHHLDRRLLQPDEVAALVCWVCSPASSGVTGALLPVDGGMTAH